jgi:antirestriction protein ArdC
MTTSPKIDVYESVTNRIIASLEAGTIPWQRPWRDSKNGSASEPFNAVSVRPYNGINLLILGTMPFPSLGWLTFHQALELGGSVRKGEKGTGIVFWKFSRVKDTDTGEEKTIPFARPYTVFNVDQCDGLDAAKLKTPAPPSPAETDINKIAANIGAIVKHGGNKAFFSPAHDFIGMPAIDAFKTIEGYQGTLAHELTHWTGHEKRLGREFGKRFGSDAYAFEELVAEIGSAFLCAKIGIPMEGLQHADYVANWLSVLKNNKKAVFLASSKARAASEFILGERAEDSEAIAA